MPSRFGREIFNLSRRERPSKTLLRDRAMLHAPRDSPVDRAIRPSREAAGQPRLSLRGDAVRLRSRPCARRSAAEDRTCSDREYARGACSESRGALEALRTSRLFRRRLAIAEAHCRRRQGQAVFEAFCRSRRWAASPVLSQMRQSAEIAAASSASDTTLKAGWTSRSLTFSMSDASKAVGA